VGRETEGRKAGLGRRRLTSSIALLALLSSCGGGGGGGDGGTGVVPPPAPAPTPTPTPPPVAVCSLADRQAWAAGILNEWYLFPELIAPNVNPGSFSTVQAYVDALLAPARAQGRDRFFTVVESLSASDAFFNSGSSAGFGLRFSYDQAGRVFVSEAFEGGPALAQNIDRGAEILAVGTSEADLKPTSELLAAGGPTAFSEALGPPTAGLARVLRVSDPAGTRNVTLAKTVFNIAPVSTRYGALIIDDGGKKVGYLNLRTFINSADPLLRNAFAQFKAQGVNEVIVDLRYNSGGLIAIGVLLNNLLLGQRTPADVLQVRTHRPSKANFDQTTSFSPQPQSVASTRIAFIGTGITGSTSEFVMNATLPYLGANTALIGTNTFGKPVGQNFFDRPQCDDRMRGVAFFIRNSSQQGDYFTGLASKFQSTCAASDDLTRQLGDPQEASVKSALNFLAGRPCGAPISSGGITAQAAGKAPAPEPITPDAPNIVQREIPGFH
jgi:carboxyl-terminal processing protease